MKNDKTRNTFDQMEEVPLIPNIRTAVLQDDKKWLAFSVQFEIFHLSPNLPWKEFLMLRPQFPQIVRRPPLSSSFSWRTSGLRNCWGSSWAREMWSNVPIGTSQFQKVSRLSYEVRWALKALWTWTARQIHLKLKFTTILYRLSHS